MPSEYILIKGARQNNLKGLNLRLPLNELIVITGVSGSGKSSLAFDTIYSEGQRRYVETFSPYARQFLDRMDKPQTERIEGIPPAIAIDQTNPVRTSRSTVGTMTELNDHIKLLFARAARLYCRGCGNSVERDSPESIYEKLLKVTRTARRNADSALRLMITFRIAVPDNFSQAEITAYLNRQGYTRVHKQDRDTFEVIQDRVRFQSGRRGRIVEALETALDRGRGSISVYLLDGDSTAQSWQFSSDYRCPDCDIRYKDPIPSSFSFNSPIGACDSCRGFGRTMGIDYSLVIPDESVSLAQGAVKPWQTKSNRQCQRDLLRFAAARKVPVDVPWRQLSAARKRWVLDGESKERPRRWYGVKGFFDWLESKSYRMHIRVLLSRYRSYVACEECRGARLKAEALDWRLGSKADADGALQSADRFPSPATALGPEAYAALPGLNVHELLLLPLNRCNAYFADLHLPKPLDEAATLLLGEIRSRLQYLVEVGLGYLTLDRQSRTLSGGEVQRINLTTALGTSLVNTLFVLDEPSIGLHARDMQRVIGVLHRLRDAGNSLIVVEHDAQIMLAADRVLDMGPGPGERGGKVVFQGSPAELMGSTRSLTAQYLNGSKRTAPAPANHAATEPEHYLEIQGAAEHNLKSIDVRLPLNRLVCVTGVSGSGKSTLVEDICYRGLRKLKGRPVDVPGKHRAIRGYEHIDDVVLVDQSPIGKTTRSNPASYVGALDGIRKLFAEEPLARERGYKPGTFSFNSGVGRCPSCGGNGFEHVEMQFLSDVYLRCADCNGRRYRPEVLEVKLASTAARRGARPTGGKSMADVLDMTVAQALEFFADKPKVLTALEPLAAVGLDYMKLGQPVPTLSGGEAQRLKLAGHLAKASASPKLLMFDEPTTGLHFDDVATLIAAFRRLLASGHSLIVIEHNLDVIEACDWVIDLGPEGGDAGGEVVCCGRPREIAAVKNSLTGMALRAQRKSARSRRARADKTPPRSRSARVRRNGERSAIEVHSAREHNLKNVDIAIPRDRFTVITGISGSGKSTVAFDILFAEGQRRYLESLNAYARQFVQPAARPDVDAIFGIPPTVAIEQRTSRGGRKSTVATMTEIYHFLRLLFVKLGVQHCPDCDIPIENQSREAVVARIMREFRGRRVTVLAPLVVARKGYYTDLAKWAASKGYSILRVDGVDTPTDAWPRLDRFKEHDIDLPVGVITVSPRSERQLTALLDQALGYGKGMVRVARSGKTDSIFSVKRACASCGRSFEELDPRLFSFNSQHGWCRQCYGTGVELEGFDAEQSGEESVWIEEQDDADKLCGACEGRRLRPEALAVRFKDRDIGTLTAMTVAAAGSLFARLRLKGRDAQIARDILAELQSRLAFLKQVGLDYLSLDRSAPSLSGGEAQRIRLASQLGSNLTGVCYILDEPTIGLHVRDTRMLLKTLAKLEKKGNTIIVVEHDEDTIRHAEHVIDLGPGAGVRGGQVVAEGSFEELIANPNSITGRFLANPLRHPLNGRRSVEAMEAALRIVGARLHNLRDVNAELPLGHLICVSGVSGSGKSTLVRDILHDNLKNLVGERRRGRKGQKGRRQVTLIGCKAIRGHEAVSRVLEVDQTPIGKTPRSCPATYVGFWDSIRRLYADTGEARIRGYTPGRFSFNVPGGRCSACDGQGMKKIEMSFLPDVRVPCDVCAGTRFGEETLAVHYRGKSIAQVLAMSVDEASEFFRAHASLFRTLELLREVGLGYLSLGQQSPTLSGGEAQRIKLVTELAKAKPEEAPDGRARHANGSHTVYVLDEPTIGLHMADVEKLIGVLHRLVRAGNTVIVIEHNLDVLAEADWLIDMGPEGGKDGGRIVAQGPPMEVARKKKVSHTGRALAAFFRKHKAAKR